MADETNILPSLEEMALLKPLKAPLYAATAFLLQGQPTHFTLMALQSVPTQSPDGQINANVARAEPICTIQMSPQTMKELFVLLRDQIGAYENEIGPVSTPFTKSRNA